MALEQGCIQVETVIIMVAINVIIMMAINVIMMMTINVIIMVTIQVYHAGCAVCCRCRWIVALEQGCI